ncbi:MAG: hypothetical protein SO152_02635 [Ruminococcus sp.]|nr:hypothetical protein [Ruminococcus sp.]
MAKNEYGNFDERNTRSYTSPKNDRQADIESEIDKILAEARQEKKAQQDFFAEEKLPTKDSSEDLPTYREKKPRETHVAKNMGETSHSTREVSHREYSQNTGKTKSHREQPKTTKDRKSHSTSRKETQPKKKSKGKGIIIVVAILAVVAGAMAGAYTYFSEKSTPHFEQNDNKAVETTTTTLPIHETLVVVTVSGTEISYNGEILSSTTELESRLSSEESLTLSLINNDADAETYNAVATVLNKFGGSYELMNKKNTNPSINTHTSTTIAPTPSVEKETEVSSSAQEVAENQQ